MRAAAQAGAAGAVAITVGAAVLLVPGMFTADSAAPPTSLSPASPVSSTLASQSGPPEAGLAPPAPPASTAPGIDASDLPAAEALGSDWSAAPEDDDADESIVSNGTAFTARDPQSVTAALVPFDCPSLADPAPLATPDSALQGNYTNAATGQNGVGMILNYGSAAAARKALAQYRSYAAECGGKELALVKSGADFLVVSRYDAMMPKKLRTWTEAVLASGSQLRLITVNAPPAQAGAVGTSADILR